MQRYWVDQILATRSPLLEELRQQQQIITARIKSIKNQSKLDTLKDAQIIGCTMNGAVNILEVLASVGVKVLLVEEAGEVLEPHLLSVLVPSIQHLVQIGDHQH